MVMSAEAQFFRVNVLGLDSPGQTTSAPLTSNALLSPSPDMQLLCVARGILKKMKRRVLVGDLVKVISIDWNEQRGVVEEFLPRTSELKDPAIANVDHVVLCFSLVNPPFEEQMITRFLVSVEAAELPISLVLNKADLMPTEEVAAKVEQCRGWGYEAIAVSCATGQGLGRVAEVLRGRSSVVAGPSGAGKSSLINVLRLGRHRADSAPLPQTHQTAPQPPPLPLPQPATSTPAPGTTHPTPPAPLPTSSTPPQHYGPPSEIPTPSASAPCTPTSSTAHNPTSHTHTHTHTLPCSSSPVAPPPDLPPTNLPIQAIGDPTTSPSPPQSLQSTPIPQYEQPSSLPEYVPHSAALTSPAPCSCSPSPLEATSPQHHSSLLHTHTSECSASTSSSSSSNVPQQQPALEAQEAQEAQEGPGTATTAAEKSSACEGPLQRTSNVGSSTTAQAGPCITPHSSNGPSTSSTSTGSSTANSCSIGATNGVSHRTSSPVASSTSSNSDGTGTSGGRTRVPAGVGPEEEEYGMLTVGDLSKIGRGKHTTRTVTLLPLPGGGLLADTPGFNQPSLERVTGRQLEWCFPEFRARMVEEGGGCRYSDCWHLMEPGCCINEAGLPRWSMYVKMLTEMQVRDEHDQAALQAGKKLREGMLKQRDASGGRTRFEVRLESKKHRRTSRRSEQQRMLEDIDDGKQEEEEEH